MSKVIALIAALALFAALPAVAAAQTEPGEGGDTVSSGNTQDGDIDQGAQGGGDAVGGEGDGDGGDAAGGDGNAGNQAAICQQNAGGDANCSIDQSQNFGDADRDGVNDRHGHGHGGHGGHARSGVVSVHNVGLARTGFDAWVLALVGGLAVAGGLGLLAAQRRGGLDA
jgi:hypothetical protein